jgi:hypothetical protein
MSIGLIIISHLLILLIGICIGFQIRISKTKEKVCTRTHTRNFFSSHLISKYGPCRNCKRPAWGDENSTGYCNLCRSEN